VNWEGGQTTNFGNSYTDHVFIHFPKGGRGVPFVLNGACTSAKTITKFGPVPLRTSDPSVS